MEDKGRGEKEEEEKDVKSTSDRDIVGILQSSR